MYFAVLCQGTEEAAFYFGCMNKRDFYKQDNVYISKDIITDSYFEKVYLLVRNKEQKVYSNEELIKLPEIDTRHQYYKEWLVRKASCANLTEYLKRKDKSLHILEVGCGNGWLSNKLAEISRTEVVGTDINLTELRQGASVFTRKNLQFVYGDIRKNILGSIKFDIIVFSASIPYFPAFDEILRTALQHLSPSGEIHIIDSFFYDEKEIAAVKQRCKRYYESIGIPEMADYFFHYSLKDLFEFNYILMKHKNYFHKNIFFKRNIFPWICIRHF